MVLLCETQIPTFCSLVYNCETTMMLPHNNCVLLTCLGEWLANIRTEKRRWITLFLSLQYLSKIPAQTTTPISRSTVLFSGMHVFNKANSEGATLFNSIDAFDQ